jgi:hypothetical protein
MRISFQSRGSGTFGKRKLPPTVGPCVMHGNFALNCIKPLAKVVKMRYNEGTKTQDEPPKKK